MDQEYQQQLKIPTRQLNIPIKVRNVDGTKNKTGMITNYVIITLHIAGRNRKEQALITGLGRQTIILGVPWLTQWNPDIDWKKGSLKWRDTAGETEKTPARAPKQPKSLECNEKSWKILKNSGGRPKTFRESAIMTLRCRDAVKYIDEPVEGVTYQTEWGADDRIRLGMDDQEHVEGRNTNEEESKIHGGPDDLLIESRDLEQTTNKENDELWIQVKVNATTTFALKYASQRELQEKE